MSLAGQYFVESHYGAFAPPKPSSDSPSIVAERRKVSDKFMYLDQVVWPFIADQNWDLHRHRQVAHYVSSDHFIYTDGGQPIVNYIDAMWLHYGKSQPQLDFLKLIGGYDYKKYDDSEYYNAFYLHTRIQFFINASVFRAWLLLATDKNYYDRSEFLLKLVKPDQQVIFWQLIQPILGKGYFYEVHDAQLPLDVGLDPQKLLRFVRKDRHGVYSGIVREYPPEDRKISDAEICTTIVKHLQELYPLYEFMARRVIP